MTGTTTKARIRPSGKWMGLMSVVSIVALTIGGIGIYSFSSKEAERNSGSVDITPPTPIENDVTIGGEGSQEFNEKLHLEAENNASLAEKKGETFIPAVIGNSDTIDKIDFNSNLPEPEKPKEETVGSYQNSQGQVNQQEMALRNAMIERLSDISGQWRYGPQQSMVYQYALLNDKQDTDLSGETKNLDITTATENKSPFRPGDLLYATLDLHLNSDKPGPVLSTVIAGPFKNSKVIGSFERKDEALVVEYSSLTTPEGTTYSIQGYAINPKVPEAYIADAVDNHYLERWGGLVAASFLEGFAESTQNSGVSSISTTGSALTNPSTVTTFPQYSLAEKSIIASGKVAERLGDIMADKFKRPPTVEAYPTHKKGDPVGILIIK